MIVGVVLRVIAMAFLSAMLAIVKWCAGQGVPLMEIMFFRNAFAMVPICTYIALTCGFGVLRTRRPLAHATRSSIGLFGMFTGFAALQQLPLTEATAIGFASPLFMVALSAPILHEAVGRHRWGAVLVGFVGVLIMVRPDPTNMNLAGTSLALLSALAAALAMITVRQMARTEPGAAIVFYLTLGGTVLGALSLPFDHMIPSLPILGLLVLGGLLGGVAQLLMTEAVRVAPVGVVAPFDYSQLIWAGVLGLLIWGELPNPWTIAGSAVVALSGFYIILRETRRARPS